MSVEAVDFVDNCVFCNIIRANDPNIILEQVNVLFYFVYLYTFGQVGVTCITSKMERFLHKSNRKL